MFTACGVITITTDFGHQGPFVATMKGRMLAHHARGANHRRDARGAGVLAGGGGVLAGSRVSLLPDRVRARRRRRSWCRHVARHHRRRRGGARVPRAGQWTARAGRRASELAVRLSSRHAAGDCEVQAADAERDLPRSRHFRAGRGGACRRAGQRRPTSGRRPRTSCRRGSRRQPSRPTRSAA